MDSKYGSDAKSAQFILFVTAVSDQKEPIIQAKSGIGYVRLYT